MSAVEPRLDQLNYQKICYRKKNYYTLELPRHRHKLQQPPQLSVWENETDSHDSQYRKGKLRTRAAGKGIRCRSDDEHHERLGGERFYEPARMKQRLVGMEEPN